MPQITLIYTDYDVSRKDAKTQSLFDLQPQIFSLPPSTPFNFRLIRVNWRNSWHQPTTYSDE